MSKFKTFFYERKDLENAQEKATLIHMIQNYFKSNNGRISRIADHIDGEGVYFSMGRIHLKYNDLILVISKEIKSEQGEARGEFIHTQNNKYSYVVLNIIPQDEYIHDFIDSQRFIDKIFSLGVEETLGHELTHYFDYKKRPNIMRKDARNQKSVDDPNLTSKEINKELDKYYNLPSEINAVWYSASVMLLKALMNDREHMDIILKDFNTFKNIFLKIIIRNGLTRWTKKNKRRVLKRMYSFWEELRDRYMKREDVTIDETFSIDAHSEPYEKMLFDVPIAINPKKHEFVRLMNHKYSTFGGNYKGVRMGFIGNDLYVWPCNIFHQSIFIALSKAGFIENNLISSFTFPVMYSKDDKSSMYTDWKSDFKNTNQRKKFIELVNKKLPYLDIQDLHYNNGKEDDGPLFSFSDYGLVKTKSDDMIYDEPEFSNIIRAYR